MKPEKTFEHQLEALGKNDQEDLVKDYVEESKIWSPDGAIVGMDTIAAFYSYVFAVFPKDKTKLEIRKLISEANKVNVVWIADTPFVHV